MTSSATTPLTTQDVQAVIAFAILNNKPGLIHAMNSLGTIVPANVSDADLFTAVNNIFATRGITGLESLLNGVPLDKSKITEEEAKNLVIKYKGTDGNIPTNSNLFLTPGWLNRLGEGIGDFLSGHSVVVQNPTVIVSKSPISTTTIIIIAAVAVIAIVVLTIAFKK